MIKKKFLILLLALSLVNAQNMVQLKQKNGREVSGDFIGTYGGYVHLLIDENIKYFNCDDIKWVKQKGYIDILEFDCSENTVTKEILFPPQLNPMTGEWETVLPDAFSEKKMKKPEKIKNHTLQVATPKRDVLPIKKTFLKGKQNEMNIKNVTSSPSSETTVKRLTFNLTENDLRNLVKKEVKRELRRILPHEIKNHDREKRKKLFQNIFLGCGAWFIFMIMLS